MLLGAIAMASLIAGLFFLRFWKTTRDRFFLYFALSFWIQAVSRVIQVFMESVPENVPIIYLIRLLAFVLILLAIADKNWPRKKPKRDTSVSGASSPRSTISP